MLNFEEVSKMTVSEFSNYVNQLDGLTISSNRDMLNFINGFILCKSLYKLNLTEEQINKLFYAHLTGQKIRDLENLYKKS